MLEKNKVYIIVSLFLVFLVIMSTEVRAKIFEFKNVSANNTADAAAGEAQLTVDVTAVGTDQVKFTFYNNIPDIGDEEAMFINEIYFYDGKLSYDSVINSSGTNYVVDEGPYNSGDGLAAYKNWTPLALFLQTEASSPGTGGDGIDPGDWLSVIFDIKDPINDDFDEIIGDMINDDLVVGIHVQGFDGGGSQSFVTPLPSAVLLGLLGLGVVGLKLRKHA
jgi:hypothetical protein